LLVQAGLAEIPKIYETIVTSTDEDVLVELLEGSDRVVVDVLEVHDGLQLAGVPSADVPVHPTGDELILVVQRA